MGQQTAAVIGGGPAGLMAAEELARGGAAVAVYDAMPSVGRKFLQAGVGGLNLTHSEPLETFVARYGAQRETVAHWLAEFGPVELRAWAKELGVETFIGSSGRIFPRELKAAPLLRGWLKRLRAGGVQFFLRHHWQGWDGSGALCFATPEGTKAAHADAALLAMGGGSWSRLGSDGAWVRILQSRGVRVNALKPANCGFDVVWSAHFRDKYAGVPVKPVTARLEDGEPLRGEFVITEHGLEGGLVYSLSAPLRDALQARGSVNLHLDLAPNRDLPGLIQDLRKPRGGQSLANHLRKQAGIVGVKAGLLREVLGKELPADSPRLAEAIKDLPLRLDAARPLDEAVSTAGGVDLQELDADLMLKRLPGVFCAGEMLDWEAPTGGYLLTACFASGYVAGRGALKRFNA